MGKILILLALAAAGVGWLVYSKEPRKPPTLDPEEWWGPPNLKGKVDDSIQLFKIKFHYDMIKDLKNRLNNTRKPPPPLQDVAFNYGFSSTQLDSWLKYWAQEYKFNKRQTFFNQYGNYKTNIQGLDIHFIRVIPLQLTDIEHVPLLLLHGWPGSVREFFESIPLLTKMRADYDFDFEVVVPSLPGYGYSDGPVREGLGPAEIAVVLRNLMKRLGFNKFYVQGGDAGAVIAADMVTLFPEEVLGLHSNMGLVQNSAALGLTVLGSLFPSLIVEKHLEERMYPLSKTIRYILEEFGYVHLQATKPDTIGTVLADSPAGLLAYILEKFSNWTNMEHKHLEDGGLSKFSKEQLIDNLMMYWAPNSFTTAVRLYAETLGTRRTAQDFDSIKTPVPSWFLQAKHELFYQPPAILKTKFTNLINTTVLDFGGHFIAMEEPKAFADDVFKAVKAFREWHKNNKTAV